jgi:hypothetical protein
LDIGAAINAEYGQRKKIAECQVPPAGDPALHQMVGPIAQPLLGSGETAAAPRRSAALWLGFKAIVVTNHRLPDSAFLPPVSPLAILSFLLHKNHSEKPYGRQTCR